MRNYAPWPWKVEPYVDAIHVHDAEGVIVADISDRKIGTGEPPANARLIAAAPELLAVLKDALGELKYLAKAPESEYARPSDEILIDIRKAIAKAEGKQ